MENFFIELGLSWVISKILPYLFMLIIGIGFQLMLRRFIVRRSINRLLFVWLITFVPIVIYFAFVPIYQGDFSNTFVNLKKSASTEELSNVDMLVVTIPNCPFCKESINVLKKIKKRKPKLRIKMLVCSSENSALNEYQKIISHDFDIALAKNKLGLAKLTNYIFPSFITVVNGKMDKIWTNDHFGLVARDYVESNLH